MPSESPVTMPRPTKSRSVVSLASLNPVTNSKHKSMSTPPSPIVQRKTMSRSSSRSNSSTGTAGPNYPPGLTMTAANRQQYIQTMQRDYSMRLGGLGRDGGYAIAATMNAPPSVSGLSGLGGSVGDFGSMRYSGDWSGSGVSRGRALGIAPAIRTDVMNGGCSSTTRPTRHDPPCLPAFTQTRPRQHRSPCLRRSSTCTRLRARRRRRPAEDTRLALTLRDCLQPCRPARTSCKRRPVRCPGP